MTKEEQLMLALRDLFSKMVLLHKFKMKDLLKDLNASEVDSIEYIGNHVDPNVTKLAETFYMTSGAISKTTRKLIKKGLIESYQKPENKKEIYFRLTARGQEIHTIHEDAHKGFMERDKAIFEQVTDEQFNSMLGFVEIYRRHLDSEIEKIDTDIKAE